MLSQSTDGRHFRITGIFPENENENNFYENEYIFSAVTTHIDKKRKCVVSCHVTSCHIAFPRYCKWLCHVSWLNIFTTGITIDFLIWCSKHAIQSNTSFNAETSKCKIQKVVFCLEKVFKPTQYLILFYWKVSKT